MLRVKLPGMMGSGRRKEITGTVAAAVRSAGSLVMAALVVACVALAVALGALVIARKVRTVHG